MKLFDNLKDSFTLKSKHRRIKNAKPLVQFDRNGNIIKKKKEETKKSEEKITSNSQTENKSQKLEEKIESLSKKIEKDEVKVKPKKVKTEIETSNNIESYDVDEPYDFPGDILKVIKGKIENFIEVAIGENSKEKRLEEKIMSIPKKTKIITLVGSVAVIVLLTIVFFNIWALGFNDTNKTKRISEEDYVKLEKLLNQKYQKQRLDILQPLPYKTAPANLDVKAGSAILVDASNGCVLYEKNADRLIPPASLTKLFVMYIVFQEIEKGKVRFDDIVELPELSWAVNQPKDASLMHLGQGQRVSLRELMQGLAVASGNDAAKAVAYHISGSQDKFIARMNAECKKLGLKKTSFVETSGYDENNITTARELAKFTQIYISKYPESLSNFHSLKYLDYPKKENLPSWQKNMGNSLTFHKENTNPLLGKLDGVDGIKTGFIYESGYNLALTAKRGDQRFFSITLQGQGKGTKAGNEGRIHDGTVMMEWAFNAFSDYIPEKNHELIFPVPSLATKNNKGKFVNLVPAWTNAISVPHIVGKEAKDSANAVKYTVEIPKYIYGEVEMGTEYGFITYKLNETTLEKVPLVADRTLEKSGLWGSFWGTLAKFKIR